jgi:hypothetical protein
MSKELIFSHVADAIVGTMIFVFRRITKQTKKADQASDTNLDNWLCFYCSRGSPVSAKTPWLEDCFETCDDVLLHVKNGGCYTNDKIVGRNEELSTIDIRLVKNSTEERQTRSRGPVIPDMMTISVYNPANLRGHKLDITSGTSGNLFWILTSGHDGDEVEGPDLFRVAAWNEIERIPLSAQQPVARIAEQIIPPIEGASLQSLMYWTSDYARAVNMTPNEQTKWMSLVSIGQFGVPVLENDFCSMTLEMTKDDQPMQHQTYFFEEPGHAYTVKTNDNMGIYIKAREGYHELLVLWWCLAAEQCDEGGNQSNQKPVCIL